MVCSSPRQLQLLDSCFPFRMIPSHLAFIRNWSVLRFDSSWQDNTYESSIYCGQLQINLQDMQGYKVIQNTRPLCQPNASASQTQEEPPMASSTRAASFPLLVVSSFLAHCFLSSYKLLCTLPFLPFVPSPAICSVFVGFFASGFPPPSSRQPRRQLFSESTDCLSVPTAESSRINFHTSPVINTTIPYNIPGITLRFISPNIYRT